MKMTTEEVIRICKERNELDFLFAITKQIAESDSIGEGHGYCVDYTAELFNNAEKHTVPLSYKYKNEALGVEFGDEYCQWLELGGVPVYELYLNQVNEIEKKNKESQSSLNNISNRFKSDAFIDNVCLSYRHDFGFLAEQDKQRIRHDCKEWMRAIQNNWSYFKH